MSNLYENVSKKGIKHDTYSISWHDYLKKYIVDTMVLYEYKDKWYHVYSRNDYIELEYCGYEVNKEKFLFSRKVADNLCEKLNNWRQININRKAKSISKKTKRG